MLIESYNNLSPSLTAIDILSLNILAFSIHLEHTSIYYGMNFYNLLLSKIKICTQLNILKTYVRSSMLLFYFRPRTFRWKIKRANVRTKTIRD